MFFKRRMKLHVDFCVPVVSPTPMDVDEEEFVTQRRKKTLHKHPASGRNSPHKFGINSVTLYIPLLIYKACAVILRLYALYCCM